MAERQLCEYGSDRISRFAEVLSFSRLANRVFAAVGGSAQTQTDSSGKLLMMSLAIDQVRSRLKLYGVGGEKPAFLLKLIETIEELQSFCISAQTLFETSAQLTGALAVKTQELALLMESYESVCANLGQNPESCLTRLLHTIDGSDYALGKRFYIDAFSDFNGVEREIIGALLNGGASVTVALHCDDLHSYSQQFAAARVAAKDLIQLASKQNIPYEISKIKDTTDDAFTHLKNRLFGGEIASNCETTEEIVFIEADSMTHECRIAAGEILNLVASGARYRDITIACADYSQYRNILRTVFRRAQIPAYYAGDTDILQQRVIHMLLSALEAASGRMDTDTVLDYLKSGFLSIPGERCDRLENYILLWNIQANQWQEEWFRSPLGLNSKESEQSRLLLRQINEDRVHYVCPLVHLQAKLRTAKNVGQMVISFHEFMEEIDLNEQLHAMAQKLVAQNKLQTAQEYVQVYSIICGLLEQMYGVMRDTVRSPEGFYQLFRAALSQCTVGTIPATLDSIHVGNLMSQRRSDCKYVFLLGANEGVFPSAQNNQTLLTDLERNSLMRLGLAIMPLATCALERELAAIAGVLESPTQRIYFGSVCGQEAYYTLRAKKLFANAKRLSNETSLIRRSERDYVNYLMANSDSTRYRGNLQEKIHRLTDAKQHTIGTLSEDAVHSLYGKTLQLSSSKIDTLAMCRLSYFLRYGLKAKARKPAQIDASVFGTFVHDVLEYVAKTIMDEGGFRKVPMERALEIAHERMQWYAREELGELWQSERAEYLFRRSFAEVMEVVKQLWDELSVSQFEPAWFELKFGKGEEMPAVRIIGKHMSAELLGVVDRADVWRNGDRIYVRVVDYKTGKTTFEMQKILHGIGLQMLLYLFALSQSGDHLLNTQLACAGVLYFPAKVQKLPVENKHDPKIEDKRKKASRRTGLILDNESVIQAMDPEAESAFLPDQNFRASTLQFEQLKAFVMRTVASLADELALGSVEANPYYAGEYDNACAKCDYREVCHNEAEIRWLESIKDVDTFWQEVNSGG